MKIQTQIFEETESNVRSYCRAFPRVFERAKGSELFSETGEAFIDFFAGAGSLNYGHNPEPIKKEILAYFESDAIVQGLDFFTSAKRRFLTTFKELVLDPKEMNYKIQFTGPTGTNAVEAALKLARKVTGRQGIFAFMGGYHGMTLGSLAATGNKYHRDGAGTLLNGVTFMPYPHGFGKNFDTIAYMESILEDSNSGIDKPAAVILESVQAEGGIIVADTEWLKRLADLCSRHEILLILDDIQVGCGRTGPFFSFERAGIQPDMVVLSKSISGYGLPMALLLLKPELDIWNPAEHNGTFRGNQAAFVGGAAALLYREELGLEESTAENARFISDFLNREIAPLGSIEIRGLGMIWGVDCTGLNNPNVAARATSLCFENRLLIERAGRNDQVIKIQPPLTIPRDLLARGCTILANALKECLGTAPNP